MLKALRDEHQLSMLTFDVHLRFGACSRFYPTLRSDDFELHLAPQVAQRPIDLVPLFFRRGISRRFNR